MEESIHARSSLHAIHRLVYAHPHVWVAHVVRIHRHVIRVHSHVRVSIHIGRRHLGRRGRRRRWRHGAEIEVVEVVGQDKDSGRHELRCPVILENVRHVVHRNDWEDDLRVGKDTMGMPEPMTLEQHSQVMSWFSLIFRLY